jgi:hypothetical protein
MQVGKKLGEFFVKNDFDFAPALFPKIAQLLGGRKTPIPAPLLRLHRGISPGIRLI